MSLRSTHILCEYLFGGCCTLLCDINLLGSIAHLLGSSLVAVCRMQFLCYSEQVELNNQQESTANCDNGRICIDKNSLCALLYGSFQLIPEAFLVFQFLLVGFTLFLAFLLCLGFGLLLYRFLFGFLRLFSFFLLLFCSLLFGFGLAKTIKVVIFVKFDCWACCKFLHRHSLYQSDALGENLLAQLRSAKTLYCCFLHTLVLFKHRKCLFALLRIVPILQRIVAHLDKVVGFLAVLHFIQFWIFAYPVARSNQLELYHILVARHFVAVENQACKHLCCIGVVDASKCFGNYS